MEGQTEAPQGGSGRSYPYLLEVRQTDEPCANCGRQITGGTLYIVGPPVRHVVCPKETPWNR